MRRLAESAGEQYDTALAVAKQEYEWVIGVEDVPGLDDKGGDDDAPGGGGGLGALLIDGNVRLVQHVGEAQLRCPSIPEKSASRGLKASAIPISRKTSRRLKFWESWNLGNVT